MKRYEVAKQRGMAWQVVLVADAETDLKLLVRDCVLHGDTLPDVDSKVTKFIQDVVDKLESEEIKRMVKLSFPMFATRLYYKWLTVFGTQVLAVAFLTALKAQKTQIPIEVKETLNRLPKVRDLGVFGEDVPNAYNRATPNGIYNLEYEKEIQRRLNEVADMTAKVDYESRYSLRASVELEVRYEHNKQQIEGLKEKGVKLAWINTHVNCSDRCKPWQGKLYSLDGSTGEKDGVKYQPLENATEVYDKYGYRNGCLSGFNCRHKLIPYSKGFRPVAIPEKAMKKQRELERQQRYMERTIRRYESRALMCKVGKETNAYKHYKGLVKEWTDKYEDFSRKNNIPFYPSRLDI